MKLREIILKNYGPYHQAKFELPTTPDEPIVLFGGKNGAGKTTLFEAIQICLHGRSAFEDRISKKEYHDTMRSKLHQSKGKDASQASIALRFDYGSFGDEDTFFVERSWRDRGKSIEENLVVERNGSRLSELEEDQWTDFLKELIPPGISQLFFFDGEKIQQLADAISTDDEFESSLLSLLGLDLIDQLEADLSIYLSNKLDEGGHEDLAEEIKSLREEKQSLEEKHENKKETLAEKREDKKNIEEKIDEKETELVSQGGSFAEKRESLKQKRKELDQEIRQHEESLQEVAKDTFPFLLVPELCKEVRERINVEQEARATAAARSRVLNEITSLAQEDSVWDKSISEQTIHQVIQTIRSELDEKLSEDNQFEYQITRDLSERDQNQVNQAIDRALNQTPSNFIELSKKLEELNEERRDIQKKIRRAPDQTVISPILEEINDLNEKKGKIEAEISNLEEEIEKIENKITKLDQKIEKKHEKQANIDNISDRAELAEETREVVQEYHEKLVKQKLSRLETVLSEYYLRLTNKEAYDRVEIDPDSMAVEIVSVHGNRKEQSQLSAGERQIFATALLWALADISDRPLPFIVDTPLGRLDGDHRANLVERFFPEAAHQVLLFSTDTEITDDYYDRLSNHIAKEYHLHHDDSLGRTRSAEGYFDGVPDSDQNDFDVQQVLSNTIN